ncbi:MAG: hypothetical protein HYV60_12710 [Planctomycetia bacterium]|nr:hypothetical protein [Planctomycetia bacterium]
MTTRLRALLLLCVTTPAFIVVQQPITLNDVGVALPDTTADEPIAAEVSAKKAVRYLDRSALNWQKTKKCATCHTNLFYLAARSVLSTILPDSGEVRSFYENYRKLARISKSFARIFRNNPLKSLHHRAMLAWCSVRVDGIAPQEQRDKTLAELLALQHDDGGWSTAGLLSDWKGLASSDGQPLDTRDSNGYGTGFVIVVALELGVPADDRRLRRGIEWLHTHQRDSGRWVTRSPVKEYRNLISGVGSTFAVLALQACGELPGGPLHASNLRTGEIDLLRHQDHFAYI